MTMQSEWCPDAEILGTFVEGGLSREEASRVALHLHTCDACLQITGDLTAWQRINPARPSRSRKLGSRWLMAAALAVVAIGVTAFLIQQRTAQPTMVELSRAAAALEARTGIARIAAFPYKPRSQSPRGLSHGSSSEAVALRAIAAKALTKVDEDPHAAGVALLVQGRTREAATALRRTTRLDPRDSDGWSDLAAAEYELAHARDGVDAHALVRSLSAADRALRLEPKHAAATFNRALALDALFITPAARDGWSDYLRVDAGSGWAAEARSREQALTRPTRGEVWKRQLPQLEAAALAGDADHVERLIAPFPQQARTSSEVIFLHDWASGDDPGRQKGRLSLASMIGDVLVARSGEALLRDATRAIRSSTGARRAALMAGHRHYYAGRDLHRVGRTIEATPLFELAVRDFRRGGSPMSLVAQYYVAICRHYAGDNEGSLRLIDELLRDAQPAYVALRAQALWQRGTGLSRSGLLLESTVAYKSAMQLFAKLGEGANLERMRQNIAANEAALGRGGVSWRMRRQSFAGFSENGDYGGLQSGLEAAARTEALSDRWDTAHALLKVAMHPALQTNPWLHLNSLTWRGLAAHRLGWSDRSAVELAEARRLLDSLPVGELHDEGENELLLVEAVLSRERDPTRAVALLDRYIANAVRLQSGFALPEAFLERGRTHAALGHTSESLRDLEECLARLDQRRSDAEGFRDAFFNTAETATREQARVLALSGRNSDAFTAVERIRARSIADRLRRAPSPPATAMAMKAVLPAQTLLVSYASLPDRLLVFSIDSGGFRVNRSDVPQEALLKDLGQWVELIRKGNDVEADVLAERLYRYLIGPVQDRLHQQQTLVLIPDPRFGAIPFPALKSRGRYLLEDSATIVAPSAAVYATLVQSTVSRTGNVLAVGNPAVDRARLGELAPLYEAEAEAQEVGAIYSQATVLTGSAATRDEVLRQLTGSAVADLASHAITVSFDPSQSFFALAPSGNSTGALYLHELAALKLKTHTVVLAGCRTSTPTGVNDISSFALAFLAAGAQNVIGTLWDVDDAAARRFSTSFHRKLRDGAPPVTALRQSQLEMLRSPSSEMRRMSAWGAFQITGRGW
jgi:CHAT domain-containing protein